MLKLKGCLVLGLAVLGLAACGDKNNAAPAGAPVNNGALSFSPAAYSVAEGTATATITVTRSGGSSGAVSAQFASSNGTATAGSDYTAASGTLNWATGDSAAKTFTVTIIDDAAVETAETVNLTLSSATGGASLGTSTAVLTITDNDAVTLGGVAATGAPLAGATITIKDANGSTRATVTNASGQFSLNAAGLTPPFLLRAQSGGTTLFSEGLVVGSSGSPATVNIHPFSNLLMQIYYQGQGLSAATVFSAAGAPAALPSATALNNLRNTVTQTLQQLLTAAAIDPATFNLITSTLVANGTGFDGVLDRTVFNANGLDFTANNGTITQAVGVNLDSNGDATPGDVSINSTTTDNSNSRSSQSSQQVAVAPAAQQSDYDAAVAGVSATLNSLIQAAAQKGTGFNAADAAAFIDAQYLDEGANRDKLAGEIVNFFNQEVPAGATVSLERLSGLSFTENGAADVVGVRFILRITPVSGEPILNETGGASEGPEIFRRQANGGFLFFGDQTLFRINVQTQFTRNYDNNGGSTDRKRIAVQANVEPNSVNGIVVNSANGRLPQNCTGGADASDPNFNTEKSLGATTLTLSKRNGLTNGKNRFDLPCAFGFPALLAYPPAGSVYSFVITPASGATVNQSGRLNASTTDAVNILTLNGQSRTQFQQANTAATVRGTNVTVTWAAPTTLPVQGVQLRGFMQSANQQTNGGGFDFDGPRLSAGATSGTISIPVNSNDSNPATNVNISVVYEGANGEQTQANVIFQQ